MRPIPPLPFSRRRAPLLALAAALLLAAACSRPPPPLPPEQAAVRSANALLEAARAADLPAFFDALPPARQNDVRALVAKAAAAIDEELWNESAAFLADFADAAQKQSANLATLCNDLAQSRRRAKGPAPAEVTPADISTLAGFLAEIAALDRDALLSGDLSALLASPSLHSVYASLLDKAAAARPLPSAYVLADADDSASLPPGSIAVAPADDPSAVTTVSLIDGVWFPDEIDRALSAACAEASQSLDRFSLDPETRTILLSAIRSLRSTLPALAAAQSPDQLKSTATLAFGALFLLPSSL